MVPNQLFSLFSKQLKEKKLEKNQGQVGMISEKLKKFGVHRCISQSTADDQYLYVLGLAKRGICLISKSFTKMRFQLSFLGAV